MGNGKIRPPQNPHPLTDHQKICYTLLRWRPLRLCQLWYRSVHEELLGKWVKYIQFLTYFRELTQMSHSSTDFHAWWLKPRVLAQRCGFWGFHWYCSPFRGWSPQNLNYVGVKRHSASRWHLDFTFTSAILRLRFSGTVRLDSRSQAVSFLFQGFGRLRAPLNWPQSQKYKTRFCFITHLCVRYAST